ncbi:TetR/AcrR family transcriptional regulator [Candidatus Poriferisodalis sp.]|uniref:TetR/AcrR family transcriptional regulator n=1 Tax=Candidatus Poriferisodalis sp. TaxID=3101277 RepID=UPI003D135391
MAEQEAVADNESRPERVYGDAPAAQPNAKPSRDAHAPADMRDQILHRARDLFAKHGYRGTSIRQLTSGVNLTPAALYYHFALVPLFRQRRRSFRPPRPDGT